MTREVVWWPGDRPTATGRVAVVTVSHNTKDITALLIWSLYRVLVWPSVEVVVVDNGSQDGSRELLVDLEEAGLCALIASEANLHHGPGLNAALSWLATRPGSSPEWVWLLDSDCVIARGDVLEYAFRTTGGRPALIGEPAWDRWHQREMVGLYSLLLDPALVWQPAIPPFTAGGDPAFELLVASERAGLKSTPFPFTGGRYVIHRGRSSLAAVVMNDDRSNPRYEWATTHHEPHFGGVPGAQERYEDLVRAFMRDVDAISGTALASACGAGG